MTRAIECHYRENTTKGTGSSIQPGDDAPIDRSAEDGDPSLVAGSPLVENRQASNNGDIILDSGLLISDPEFANLGLDWDGLNIDFADFLNPQTNDETFQDPSSKSSTLFCHSTSSTDQTGQPRHAISSANVSITPSPTHNVRSLIQRPRMRTGEQRISKLIFHTLKSYPLMMLRHNTLPPFIHSGLISYDVENNHMEPMLNCISLVHMISRGVQGSRKLFWKNVQLECERLYAEVRRVCDDSRRRLARS